MANAGRKALQLELKKQYAQAAKAWEEHGQIEKALFNYQRAGNVKRAVELALRHDMRRKAAEIYLKAEIYDKAAQLFHKERDYSAAARAYRHGGAVAQAAAMFETAGEWVEAARVYELVGDFMKAGQLYDKGGDVDSSARVYQRALQGNDAGLGDKKDLARVAAVLTRARDFDRAAELYIQSDELCEAVVAFVRMGELEGAAKLLTTTHGDVGFEVLTRVDYAAPSAIDFAKTFYLARDHQKAARVFESCGVFDKAAYLFEKCQDYQHAAEMFLRAEQPTRAAAMYEKAGLHVDAGNLFLRHGERERAADAFEVGGEVFEAGRLFHVLGQCDRALEMLQRVPEGTARYAEASVPIADILRSKGLLDLAAERYRVAIGDRSCDSQTLALHYGLAELRLEQRRLEEAEELLGAVARLDFGHRDVAELLDKVRAWRSGDVAIPEAESPAPTAAGDGHGAVLARMEGMEILAATPLFAELTLVEMKRFWEIAELRSAAADTILVDEGEEGTGLWIVRRGSVNVMKAGDVLVQLHPGEFFGEMALMDRAAKTSARVAAASDVDLFFLGREPFERLLSANDGTALKMHRVFVSTLCQRLRRSTDDLAQMRTMLG